MAKATAAAATSRRAMRDITIMSSSINSRQSLPDPCRSGRGRLRLLHHAQVFSNRGTRQPEVIAQHRTRIGFAVETPALQFRNDEIDKLVKRSREPGRHDAESVRRAFE